jgi:hypothetical protein
MKAKRGFEIAPVPLNVRGNERALVGLAALQPFNGDRLQIMPWPDFQHMTLHEVRAIYEYLGAILCIEGPPAPSVLHNDCI